MTEIYETNNTIFEGIFNEEEITKHILDNAIPVFFQKSQIFIDDTLEIIKEKNYTTRKYSF